VDVLNDGPDFPGQKISGASRAPQKEDREQKTRLGRMSRRVLVLNEGADQHTIVVHVNFGTGRARHSVRAGVAN